MNKDLLILNFSDVKSDEKLTSSYPSKVIDFSFLDGTNCYCSKDSEIFISSALSDTDLHNIHFIDSGDYHYLSKIFIDRIEEDFSLVLLDNHPDMQAPAFGNILSCGGWVKVALDTNPRLKKVLILGMDRDLESEVLGYGDRVEYVCSDSLERCIPALSCLPERLPVYLSIDKDVLSEEFASTDWNQGRMSKDEMTGILSVLIEGYRLLGVDICGAKPASKGGSDKDFYLNSLIDRTLIEMLKNVLE